MSAPPITIRNLDHVVIRCMELAPMLAFYRDVLGLPLVRSNDAMGLYHLRAGSSLVDLVCVGGPLGGEDPPRPAHANMAHLCLRLESPDWERLLDYLTRAGLDPGTPQNRFGADGIGPSVYVTDPEGNIVEFKGETA